MTERLHFHFSPPPPRPLLLPQGAFRVRLGAQGAVVGRPGPLSGLCSAGGLAGGWPFFPPGPHGDRLQGLSQPRADWEPPVQG